MRDRSPPAIPKSSDHDAVLLRASHRFDSVENSIAALSNVAFPLAKGVSDFWAHSSKPWDNPVDLRFDEKGSLSNCLKNRLTVHPFRASRSTANGALPMKALLVTEGFKP